MPGSFTVNIWHLQLGEKNSKPCHELQGDMVWGTSTAEYYYVVQAVANQPVSVAIEADERDFQLYAGGVYDAPCGTALDHGVLVVGYGHDKTADGTVKPFWKVCTPAKHPENFGSSQVCESGVAHCRIVACRLMWLWGGLVGLSERERLARIVFLPPTWRLVPSKALAGGQPLVGRPRRFSCHDRHSGSYKEGAPTVSLM